MSSQPSNLNQNSTIKLGFNDIEQIINCSSESIVCIDKKFQIIFSNASFKHLAFQAYGITIDFDKTNYFELIPSFLTEHYQEILKIVFEGETHKNETFRSFPNKNIPDTYFEEVFKPLLDSSNQVDSVCIFIKDITQSYKTELQLAESEATLKGVFNSSADEIVSINIKYEITSFNQATAESFEKLTGQKPTIGLDIVKHFAAIGQLNYSNNHKKRFDRGLKGERFTEQDSIVVEGITRHQEISINPVFVNSSVIGLSIFTRDVTQKVIAEKKIRENDEFLKSVQNLAQIGSWRQNLKTGEFTCSNYCFEIFGLIPSSKPSKSLFEGILGYENQVKIELAISDYLSNKRKKQFEIEIGFSQAYIKYLSCFVNPILSENGELTEIICVFQDITSQKQTLKELDKINEYLNTMLNATDFAIITTNEQGVVSSFNKAAENLLEYKPSEVIGIHTPVLWHDIETLEILQNEVSNELNSEITLGIEVFHAKARRGLKSDFETTFTSKSGKKIPVQLSVSPILDKNKNIVGFVGVSRNISERIELEHKLKEQNLLLNTVINSLPFDFWARDKNGEIILQNPKSIQNWGKVKGIPLDQQDISPEILEHWRQNNEKAYNGLIVNNEFQYDINKETIFVNEIISPIVDENNNVMGIIGMNLDYTERKKAEFALKDALEAKIRLNEELLIKEEELRQSIEELISTNEANELREIQISTIFDNSPEIILSVDTNLIVQFANKKSKELFFEVNNVALRSGCHLSEFFENHEEWLDHLPLYQKVLKGETIAQTTDFTHQKFGRYICEEYYSPIKNEHNEIIGVAINIKDITEKTLTQETLARKEKIFKDIINSSPDFISFVDTDFKFQQLNQAALKFLNQYYESNIELGKSKVQDLGRDEFVSNYIDGYKRAFAGETLKKEIARQNNSSENPISYSDEFYYPVYDETGKIIGAASFSKNVSDIRIAENKAKAFQQKFYSIMNSSTDFIILINTNFTIGAANARYIDRVKKYYDIDVEFDKTNVMEILPSHLHLTYQSNFEKVLLGKSHVELLKRTYAKNNEVLYSEEHYFPIFNNANEVTGISIFARDVTEKIEAQEKIHQQEKRFIGVINSTESDGILVINKELVLTGFNKSYERVMLQNYGIVIEAAKFSIFDLLPPEFHDEYASIFKEVFEGKSKTKNNKHPIADGKFIYSSESFYPIFDNENNVIEASVFIRDTTESILTSEIIKENEFRFKKITDITNAASYEHEIEKNITVWYGGFEGLFGPNSSNAPNLNTTIWRESIHIDDKEKIISSYWDAINDPNKTSWEEEYRITDNLGNIKYVIDKAVFLKNEEGVAIKALGGIQDVTLIKLQEEQIKRSLTSQQKLNEELTQINDRLGEKESQMKAIMDSTSDFILLFDTEFKIHFFNNAYRDRVKEVYDIEVKIGDNVFDFLLEEQKIIYNNFKEKLKENKPIKLDTYVKEIDTYREDTFIPIQNSKGEIWGYSAFIRDITDKVKVQKTIEENRNLLNETQKIAKTGSWRLDLTTQNLTWSDNTFEIYEVEKSSNINFEFFKSIYSQENTRQSLDTIEEAIIQSKNFKIEGYYTTKTGKEKYLVGLGDPFFDENGKAIGYLGTVQDISDRKKIELDLANTLLEAQKLNEILANREEELSMNEEELRTYVDELSSLNKQLEEKESTLNKNIQLLNLTGLINKAGGWEFDVEKSQYYLTDQMYMMRGIEVGDQAAFSDTSTFYSADDEPFVRQKFTQLIEKGDPYDIEIQVTTNAGKKIWIRSIGYAETKKGKTIRAYGAIQDITKRKNDQQKLIDSETNLKSIINNTDFSIWAIDINFRLLAFNDSYSKIFSQQFNKEAKVGLDILKNDTSEKSETWKLLYARAFDGEKFTIEMESNDFMYEYFLSPITTADGQIRGVAVIGNNISPRKAIENQIKLNEEKFRALFEKSNIAMMLIDKDKVIECNNHTLKLFQITNRPDLNNLIMPMFMQTGFEGFSLNNNDLNTTKPLNFAKERIMEWTHTNKDGSKIYGEMRATPILIDDNEVLFAQFYDLTERKIAELKVFESENFLNSIVDNIPIGMLITDLKGEVQRINNAMLALTGIPEDWKARGGINFLTSNFLNNTGASFYFKTAVNGGVVINEELEIDFGIDENIWNFRDDVAWFLVTAFPIYENKEVKNVVITLIDITSDKKNQQKIKQNAEDLIESNKKTSEYKLMALRSAMNPHFLFNSLNSIQYFIAKNEKEQALNYLSLFSKLIRSILNSSITNHHSLSEEISILKFYTELETLRFDNKFETKFIVDQNIELDNVEIPSLIIQPYVENAILHGLYNKGDNKGVLLLSFELLNESTLLAVIEDNGVGRKQALEIKQASKMHRSVGMLVTQERLELINKDNNLNVKIIDLKNKKDEPIGTRVEVLFNI